MDDKDIDLSDIPEMTGEEFAHCLVRFRNKPVGQGGEWHKPVMADEMSDERLEELRARALSEWQMLHRQVAQG